MNEREWVIARRIAFLQRELERLGDAAFDAEHELRIRPTQAAARHRAVAVYILAGDIWKKIGELRAQAKAGPAVIRFDLTAAEQAAARSYRWALN
jgi:protein involved in temperature-dependent protein secretion